MRVRFLEYWGKLQRGASISAMHLGRVGIRSFERFAQHQLDVLRLILEANRRQVQQGLRVAGPVEMLGQQPRVAVGIGIQVLEHVLETLEIMADSRQALGGSLQEETTTLLATLGLGEAGANSPLSVGLNSWR